MFTAEKIPSFDLRLQRKVRMKRRFSQYFPRVLPAENICVFSHCLYCALQYGSRLEHFHLSLGLEVRFQSWVLF